MWSLIDAVDVLAPGHAGAVVALGDSISDPTTTVEALGATWPEHLARRFRDAGRPVAVVSAGISGNRVIPGHGGNGAAALERFERDVLDHSGVTDVVVLEGVNDIIRGAAAEELAAAHATLAERLARGGVRVHGGLLTPAGAGNEPERARLNAWIASAGAYDSVIDFAAAVADSREPFAWQPGTSDDGLHGTAEGYRRMATAVELAALGRRC